MRNGTGAIAAACTKEAVYIRVEGLATLSNCLNFKAFTDALLGDGVRSFIVDLRRCEGMDSTFMGLLVGLAAALRSDNACGVALVNVSESNRKLLAGLGVDHYVIVGKDCSPEDLFFETIPADAMLAEERLRLIQHAHERLVALHPENEKKFGPFLRQLCLEILPRDAKH